MASLLVYSFVTIVCESSWGTIRGPLFLLHFIVAVLAGLFVACAIARDANEFSAHNIQFWSFIFRLFQGLLFSIAPLLSLLVFKLLAQVLGVHLFHGWYLLPTRWILVFGVLGVLRGLTPLRWVAPNRWIQALKGEELQ